MTVTSSAHINGLIRKGETLNLEFKSDVKGFPDRDLVSAVVALANTEGGDLLLGVEDDGRITSLHPNHQNLSGLAALIANKTNPLLSTADLAVFVQTPETAVLANLEKLVEAHGAKRSRTYTLSAKVCRHTGQKAAYVRQTGFDPIQQEQMVLSYIDKHGFIKRAETADLCRISPFQATRLLRKMPEAG